MTSGRKIGVFLALTAVPSFSLVIAFWQLGGKLDSPAGVAITMLYSMPPAFAALAVKGAMAKDPVIADLGLRLRPDRWFFVAWLLAPLLLGLAMGIGWMLPGVEPALSVNAFVDAFRDRVPAGQLASWEHEVRSLGYHPALYMLLRGMVAGLTLNAVLALGEELGFRGLLHHELGGPLWRKSLVTGLIWGIWYAPLVLLGHNFPEHGAVGLGLWLPWCMLCSVILGYLRERSGSVIAPAVMRGTLNSLGSLPLILTAGGSDLWTGHWGVAAGAAMAVGVLGVAIYDRGSRVGQLLARRSS